MRSSRRLRRVRERCSDSEHVEQITLKRERRTRRGRKEVVRKRQWDRTKAQTTHRKHG